MISGSTASTSTTDGAVMRYTVNAQMPVTLQPTSPVIITTDRGEHVTPLPYLTNMAAGVLLTVNLYLFVVRFCAGLPYYKL